MASRRTDAASTGRTGYYADPQSPIAATPQRRPRGAPGESPAATTMSPMHSATTAAPKREGEETWTQALFSPVLRFIGAAGDEDEGDVDPTDDHTLAASPGQAHLARGSGGAGGSVGVYAGGSAPAPASPHAATASFSVTTVEAASLRTPAGSAIAATVTSMGGTGVIAIDTSMDQSGVDEEPTAPQHSSAVSPATSNSSESEDYEYELEEFNPYLFMKLLPDYASVAPPVPRICLPAKAAGAPPVTLVLDLDETLVHCSVEPMIGADLTFPVDFNGTLYTVYVRKRPHLARFLEAIYDKFEVVVFTASQKVYADKLLNLIDPTNKYFKHRMFRDSCLNVDGNFLKDLTVLGRDLKTTVLVDNSPHAFGYQIDNGIPIESWFEDPADTELIKLAAFLQTIQNVPDVRPHLRRKFNVRGLVDRAVPPHGAY